MEPGRRASIAARYRRALATVRRTKGIVARVIRKNERLAQMPGHEASARQRIEEGHAELDQLTQEEAVLEQRVHEPD